MEIRRIARKGNQQPVPAERLVGSFWFHTAEGRLINLELAQSIEVAQVENEFHVIAAYNDASEVVLAKYETAEGADILMTQIEDTFGKSFRQGVQQPTGGRS